MNNRRFYGVKILNKIILTIGICTKNSAETVDKTLESIASQDFPLYGVEIIIVDGGSRDKTLEIVRKFLERTKIKGHVFCDKGAGLSSARQIVLDNAQGNYILWVDSDVILSTNFINHQLSFMEKSPHVALVWGRGCLTETKSLVAAVHNLLFCTLDVVYFGATISRTSALREVGGFDTRIKGAAEDVEIKIRLHLNGWKCLINEKAIFYHIPKNTLRDLFKQYSWYGYGDHFLHHKYPKLINIPYRLPPIFFGWGVKLAKKSYKKTRKKESFLIPLLCLFISICWCFGFVKAHGEDYGHY